MEQSQPDGKKEASVGCTLASSLFPSTVEPDPARSNYTLTKGLLHSDGRIEPLSDVVRSSRTTHHAPQKLSEDFHHSLLPLRNGQVDLVDLQIVVGLE